MSKGHRNQPKELPVAKAGTIEQKKKKKKEVALHYDSNDKYSVVYIDRNKLLNK